MKLSMLYSMKCCATISKKIGTWKQQKSWQEMWLRDINKNMWQINMFVERFIILQKKTLQFSQYKGKEVFWLLVNIPKICSIGKNLFTLYRFLKPVSQQKGIALFFNYNFLKLFLYVDKWFWPQIFITFYLLMYEFSLL